MYFQFSDLDITEVFLSFVMVVTGVLEIRLPIAEVWITSIRIVPK